jgi:hypothetical protein
MLPTVSMYSLLGEGPDSIDYIMDEFGRRRTTKNMFLEGFRA